MPNKKKKNRVPRQFLLLWTRALCRGALILKTGVGSTKQSKEECKKGKKKKGEKKPAIKQDCEEKYAKSLQPLLTPRRFSSLAPLCFHLSCDVSYQCTDSQETSLEHLALMEKGFCRLKRSGGSWGCDSTWAPVSEMWPQLVNRSPRSAPSHWWDWISAVHRSVNTLSVCLSYKLFFLGVYWVLAWETTARDLTWAAQENTSAPWQVNGRSDSSRMAALTQDMQVPIKSAASAWFTKMEAG